MTTQKKRLDHSEFDRRVLAAMQPKGTNQNFSPALQQLMQAAQTKKIISTLPVQGPGL
jgi:hypothetical protein